MNTSSYLAQSEFLWAALNNCVDPESIGEQQLEVLADLTCRLMARGMARKSDSISSPGAAKQLVKTWIGLEKHEVFGALYLDSQNRLIDMCIHFYGTINSAVVHPRIIVDQALKLNCAAVVFCHNHPSGVAEPSSADRRITEKLVQVLSAIDVQVLDHLVVGEEVSSFAELGLL